MAAGGDTLRRFLLAGVLVAGFVLLLYWLFGHDLTARRDMRVLYLSGFLVLLLAGFTGRARFAAVRSWGWGRVVGNLGFWLLMLLLLVGGYSYKDELRQVGRHILGQIDPAWGQVDGRSVSFAIADDGQFHIEANVGGVPVRFILDTGASDVMLSPFDARRLGFDPAALSYTRIYQTANGTVAGASVVLPSLEIGSIRLTNLPASVMQTDSSTSLLGMSFLSRLASYKVDGSRLTLVQ
jgi:aspartyl protease family protein